MSRDFDREIKMAPASGPTAPARPITKLTPRWRVLKLFKVKLRRDGRCPGWKLHVSHGCVREVLGYLDAMARLDPQRAVWAAIQSMQKNARRQDGKVYSLSRIKHVISALVSAEIITGVVSVERNGKKLRARIIKEHDFATNHIDGFCVCLLPETHTGESYPQQHPHGAGSSTETLKVRHRDGVIDNTPPAPEIQPNRPPNQDITADHSIQSLSKVSLTFIHSNEPTEEQERSRAPRAEPLALSAEKSDPDLDQNQLIAEELTIDQVFFECLTIAQFVAAISAFRFDPSYLLQYGHKEELMIACREGKRKLSSERFCGARSCARLMGTVMDIMKQEHGLNVPGGWLPVLNQLRATAKDETIPEQKFLADRIGLECLGFAGLTIAFLGLYDEIRELAMRDSEFMATLVEAKRLSVTPSTYAETELWAEKAQMLWANRRPEGTALLKRILEIIHERLATLSH